MFGDALYDLLSQEGDVDFTAVSNAVGVICRGSLNSRLVMLLRMFGTCPILSSSLLMFPTETPKTRECPYEVDHEQLAYLWRHLAELFTVGIALL